MADDKQHNSTDHEHSHETDTTLPGLEPLATCQTSKVDATTSNQTSRQRESPLLCVNLG